MKIQKLFRSNQGFSLVEATLSIALASVLMFFVGMQMQLKVKANLAQNQSSSMEDVRQHLRLNMSCSNTLTEEVKAQCEGEGNYIELRDSKTNAVITEAFAPNLPVKYLGENIALRAHCSTDSSDAFYKIKVESAKAVEGYVGLAGTMPFASNALTKEEFSWKELFSGVPLTCPKEIVPDAPCTIVDSCGGIEICPGNAALAKAIPIKTIEQFSAMKPNRHYILMNDLDFQSSGTPLPPMKGIILNGNHHTLRNFNYAQPYSPQGSPVGIFSSLESSVVKDLNLKDITLSSSIRSGMGSLAGQAGLSFCAENINLDNIKISGNDIYGANAGGLIGVIGTPKLLDKTDPSHTRIKNIRIQNSTIAAPKYTVGGIIGTVMHPEGSSYRSVVLLEQLTAQGVFSGHDVGGIVSYTAGNGLDVSLKNVSFQNGNLLGSNRVGGILSNGHAQSLTQAIVRDSILKAENREAGGIAAEIRSNNTPLSTGILKVSDLRVENTHIEGTNNVGGLFADSDRYVEIDNSQTSGSIEMKESGLPSQCYGGGLVGTAIRVKISRSRSSMTLKAPCIVGGLVGGIPSAAGITISESYATGDIVADGGGGILGSSASGGTYLRKVYYSGKINARVCVGGIVGFTTAPIEIEDAVFSGEIVSAMERVGGILGMNQQGEVRIIRASVLGNINASSDRVGGLVGSADRLTASDSYVKASLKGHGDFGGIIGSVNNANIERVYFDGPMTDPSGQKTAQGIVGTAHYPSRVTDNTNTFWDRERSGTLTTRGGGVSKTSAEMLIESSYTGWNTTDTWLPLSASTLTPKTPQLRTDWMSTIGPIPESVTALR